MFSIYEYVFSGEAFPPVASGTMWDIENHIDIADWLVRWKLHPETFETEKRNITFEKVKAFISEEYQDEVLALIEDLDLRMF